MIERLQGTLIVKQAPYVVLDIQGVGYEAQVSMSSFYQLPELNQNCLLYTHFVVREDAQLLYGFVDTHERTLFRHLIKVNGVGPKMALSILSGMDSNALMQCMQDENVAQLTKLPGVGKKTAERLVIEMRDKLKQLPLNTATLNQPKGLAEQDEVEQEALDALMVLGYKSSQASKMVAQVYQAGMRSEAVIKKALQTMCA
ncbi:MAG: Holliday junction branch migration protein RuvA [Shewanellaceae bacterium]|nr:Holliday junction branch migration protein RuvA [Shewanellaceae bacterium]